MKLHRNKIKARLGTNYVERVVLEAGAKPIPVPEDLDTGIDGLIEFSLKNGPAKLIAYQVKCGASFFDEMGAKCQLDRSHMFYWRDYLVPVLLIIVREGQTAAVWMDIRQHLRSNPSLLLQDTCVVRPPASQTFSVAALTSEIEALHAQAFEFGDAIAALTHDDSEKRISALSLLYRFRMERATPFCLAAALRLETNATAIAEICNFYSRYLPHPEWSFTGTDLKTYATSLLTGFQRADVLRILTSFEDDDEYGDWSGATEIYDRPPDEVWGRSDVIARGTLHQGIAEVVRCVAEPDLLLSIVSDPAVALGSRKSATALFGYLGYSCTAERLDSIMANVNDAPLHALLYWLRFIVAEEAENLQS